MVVTKPTEAGTSPYDVPSSVRNNWAQNVGGKAYSYESGRKLVYDVYAEKYIQNGYRIVNRDFGKGTQPYLHFAGWAVLFGHKHHTETNHDTYIVARKVGSSDTKIYGTVSRNISATEDLEFNNQGPGHIYNKCPSSVRNVPNTTCNMEYKNVGFDAYIPLNELFPNKYESASWILFIVKRVDNHIVYEQLVLPFEFSKRDFGVGKISLSSGENTKTLRLNGTGVMRRLYPREPQQSVIARLGSDRYFRQGTYKTKDYEETQTAIWYGVESPQDNNKTRWAVTAYWLFGGEQATLKYTVDNTPPSHISHSIKNYRYKNGNDYWVRPNDEPIVVLRQYDAYPGNKYQYIRLTRSGIDVRARHDFTNSSANNISNVSTYDRINQHIGIHYANRTENSNGYGRVEWHIIPRTHGHNYNIQYHYTDRANNAYGYDTKSKHGQNAGETGMRLRVDGVAPTVQFRNSNDTSDFNERDWSDKEIVVRLKFSDSHSGYKRSRYAWTQSPNTPSSNEWSSWQTSANYLVRKSEKGTWYLHVQAEDNVGNVRTVSKGEYKFNHKPEIKLTYSPNKIFEGDTVTLTAVPTDEDGDLLTVIIEEYVDGEWKLLKREEKVKPGQSVIHKIRVDARYYIIRATAIDDANQSGEDQVGFAVIPLEIKGFVEHTDDWKAIHEANEHDEDMFFAGEIFKTKALVTDHVIEKVTVEFMGEQINDDIMRFTEEMQPNPHPLYVADVFRTEMGAPSTRLKNGPVYFLFTAEWKNGVVKHDLVVVNIIDGAYNAFNFHRTN